IIVIISAGGSAKCIGPSTEVCVRGCLWVVIIFYCLGRKRWFSVVENVLLAGSDDPLFVSSVVVDACDCCIGATATAATVPSRPAAASDEAPFPLSRLPVPP
ncbi:hypothetical protein NY486_26460, partial [Enterobacter hormaechei]|nr:hypothetical protein [Enterobacter hormaechei]